MKRKVCNVYDLSPRLGCFDLVFCGDVLQHLFNPLLALINIRSVTREKAVIATLVDPAFDQDFPDRPWLRFGHREHEGHLGEAGVYWRFSTAALQEMMAYAGFPRTEPQEHFTVPPSGVEITSVVGYVD